MDIKELECLAFSPHPNSCVRLWRRGPCRARCRPATFGSAGTHPGQHHHLVAAGRTRSASWPQAAEPPCARGKPRLPLHATRRRRITSVSPSAARASTAILRVSLPRARPRRAPDDDDDGLCAGRTFCLSRSPFAWRGRHSPEASPGWDRPPGALATSYAPARVLPPSSELALRLQPCLKLNKINE